MLKWHLHIKNEKIGKLDNDNQNARYNINSPTFLLFSQTYIKR